MHITSQSILFAIGLLGFVVADGLLPQSTPMTDDHSSSNPTPSTTKPKKPKHSQCYNYFLNKDKCVFAAKKKSERCPVDSKDQCGHAIPTDMPIVFKSKHKHSSQSTMGLEIGPNGINTFASKSEEDEASTEFSAGVPSKKLVRRYDSELDSFPIAGGDGICGNYKDTAPGVCLWASAADVPGSLSGGWINGTFTKPCGRQVFIQRKGFPEHTVYAPVVDGCTFNATTEEPGCFRIAFTQATFNELNPTQKEIDDKIIHELVWDFDNALGTKPENAAI
ncbi:hypothetical protein PGT21_023329 [Puccinia graminis f. sp. tritici]|uniref:Secreted protein n=2 Tax=Puccinia graminis f. sp. tritici TaxID=56615 RepID=E3JZK0_PUCGT|nr:uncharacterized protein PGTG_03431 [Puccinia graminis f. sp. tritici CRL 75-36-700-3]EFP77475.1 hypothetical protein PGTG_03431 [Puccinia graminis f. sp. tritici CRL 75-36-700-3]KAA1110500.1 hypothetical protein PGT21_023329 [Puccinia graminis f. sp. tritici]